MAIWNKDAVLADVVWAIRKFRPDILVNRFNAENSGSTHGHHTASAMLALEAFDLAGDPKAFPEQLKYVQPWQPRRIFFNTSWWFYGSQELLMPPTNPGWLILILVSTSPGPDFPTRRLR